MKIHSIFMHLALMQCMMLSYSDCFTRGNVLCSMCRSLVDPVGDLLADAELVGKVKEVVFDDFLCVITGFLKVLSQKQCVGFMDEWNLAIPAVAKSLFTQDRICNEAVGFCTDHVTTELSSSEYVQKRLKNKPDLIKNDTFLDDLYQRAAGSGNGSRPTVNSLHFGDIHLDQKYEVGAPVKCDFVNCCRNYPGLEVKQGDPVAGKWGEYSCDLPHRTLKNML